MRLAAALLTLAAAAMGAEADPAEVRSRIASSLTAFEKDEATEESDLAEASLASLGRSAVPFLEEALRDQPPPQALHLMRVLARIGGAEAVAALVAQIPRREGEIRAEAARQLGRLGAKDAAKTLLPLLSDGDWTVRRDAAEALGALKSREAVPGLIALLSDVNLHVRDRAHRALKAVTGQELGHEPAPWKTWVEEHPEFMMEGR